MLHADHPKFSSCRNISKIYRQLVEYSEMLEEVIPRCVYPAEKASAVILEEDITCLVEEWEELMIAGSDAGSRAVSSFELRSLTVLEEVECLLARTHLASAGSDMPQEPARP